MQFRIEKIVLKFVSYAVDALKEICLLLGR